MHFTFVSIVSLSLCTRGGQAIDSHLRKQFSRLIGGRNSGDLSVADSTVNTGGPVDGFLISTELGNSRLHLIEG